MKKIFSFLSMIFIIAAAFYIYARFIEPNLLTVQYENIKSSLISEDKEELKIIQFSDMHISEYFDEKNLKNVRSEAHV